MIVMAATPTNPLLVWPWRDKIPPLLRQQLLTMLYTPGLVVSFAAFGHLGNSPSSAQVVASPIRPMGAYIGVISRMCPHASGALADTHLRG